MTDVVHYLTLVAGVALALRVFVDTVRFLGRR